MTGDSDRTASIESIGDATSRRRVVELFLGGGTALLAGCTDENTANPNDPEEGGNPTPSPEGTTPGENPNPDPGQSGNYLKFPFEHSFTTEGPFDDEFGEFARVEASNAGYALEYPERWRLRQPSEVEGAVLVEEPSAGNAFVYATRYDSERGLDELVRWVRTARTERALWTDVEALDERETETVDGREMVVVDFRYVVREAPVREKIGFVSTEFDYTVSLFANAERYTDPLAEVAGEIVASFELLG